MGSPPITKLVSLASVPAEELGPLGVNKEALAIGNTNTAKLKLSVDLRVRRASSFILALFQSQAESTLLTYNTGSRTLALNTVGCQSRVQ